MCCKSLNRFVWSRAYSDHRETKYGRCDWYRSLSRTQDESNDNLALIDICWVATFGSICFVKLLWANASQLLRERDLYYNLLGAPHSLQALRTACNKHSIECRTLSGSGQWTYALLYGSLTVGIWAKISEYLSDSCLSSSSSLFSLRNVVGLSCSAVALVFPCSTLDWNAVVFLKLTEGSYGGALVHCQYRNNKSS